MARTYRSGQCRKVVYHTKESAYKGIIKRNTTTILRIYWCNSCNGFHLTHKKRKP